MDALPALSHFAKVAAVLITLATATTQAATEGGTPLPVRDVTLVSGSCAGEPIPKRASRCQEGSESWAPERWGHSR